MVVVAVVAVIAAVVVVVGSVMSFAFEEHFPFRLQLKYCETINDARTEKGWKKKNTNYVKQNSIQKIDKRTKHNDVKRMSYELIVGIVG